MRNADRQQDVPAGKKRCKACGEIKPVDDYYRHSTTADGRRPLCKPCHVSRTGARLMTRYYTDDKFKKQNAESSKAHMRRKRAAAKETSKGDNDGN